MSDAPAPLFAPDVVEAICRHMNDDHPEDCLRIVRGLAGVDAREAEMVGVDGARARFRAVTDDGPVDVVLPWSEPVTDRAQVRAEVVRMHDEARARLDAAARPDEG